MRRPVPQAARQSARTGSIPAPVRGWNASAPLADMDPADAIALENVIPRRSYVELRRGYSSHATGVGTGAVESLLTWEGPATRKMFAASSTALYEVTSAGGVGAAAVSSLSNGRWQWVNMTTAGGSFLLAANGADGLRSYNGTTWATQSLTGITAADVIGLTVHKNRLWMVLEDSTKAAYLAVNSISGSATTFELGAVFQLGGSLQAIGTWTIDGGDGVDDHLAFVSSRGEVAIYRGTDPSSAADWALVGVYRLGAPIGRRCLVKVGGDMAVITVDGVQPLSASLALDRAAVDNVAITARISNAVNEAVRQYGTLYGWQLLGYPLGKVAILNVPTIEGTASDQYVMDIESGAWCRWTGLDASCFALLGDDLYFGGPGGVVYKADTGTSDDGDSIAWEVHTAWSDLRRPGQIKHVTAVAPLLQSDGGVFPSLDVLADYEARAVLGTPTAVESAGSAWDEDDWDDADWADAVTATRGWTGATAVGSVVAVRMRGLAKGISLKVSQFDVLYQVGGVI